MDFPELVKLAETRAEQKRFRSAITYYQEALKRFPQHSPILSYNLGVLYQVFVGDGEEARKLLQKSIEQRCLSEGLVRPRTLDDLEANACENLMLLSLSYEEYDSWAKRLARLQPQNAILHQQRLFVQQMYDRGLPWSAVLSWMASTYCSPDPAKDSGRYGNAASTYHLLILHRKELQLRREDWRLAVLGYAATTLYIFSVCGQSMERTFKRVELEEFAFVVEKALPLVKEYVTANPSDLQAQESLGNLRKAIEVAARSPQVSLATAATDVSSTQRPDGRCTVLVLLLGAAVGAVLGHFLLVRFDPPWGAVVGGVAGLIMLGTAWHSALEKARQAKKQVSSVDPASRSQPVAETPGGMLTWQMSSSLTKAIACAGLSGHRFQLLRTDVEGGELTLTFHALTPIPENKVQEAGLALRCVVWLSLPVVISHVRRIQLGTLGKDMTVRLGAGVPVPVLAMRMGNDHTPPLQCTSDEEDRQWEVHVKPTIVSCDNWEQQVAAQNRIFKELRLGFEELKEKPISLNA